MRVILKSVTYLYTFSLAARDHCHIFPECGFEEYIIQCGDLVRHFVAKHVHFIEDDYQVFMNI